MSAIVSAISNLSHDPLGPLNTSLNHPVSPWVALWTTEQVICALHMQRGQNCRHDAPITRLRPSSMPHNNITVRLLFVMESSRLAT
jgi:hypothetical protein